MKQTQKVKKGNSKFHGAVYLSKKSFLITATKGKYYPDNTVVTFEQELVDTHNAMDFSTGTFTAPFAGFYGFVFYFESHRNYFVVHTLYALHNGERSPIYYNDHNDNNEMDTSNTVYFAQFLNPGNTIKIDSGYARIRLGSNTTKFMGFLLSKSSLV